MDNNTTERKEEAEIQNPESLTLERNLKTLSEEFQQKVHVMGQTYQVDIKTKIGFTITETP